jgi:hypothetical protein
METGIKIPYEVADGVAIAVMQDQLDYLLKEQLWFEADDAQRLVYKMDWGYGLYVHPEDYAKNAKEYIPALKLLITYFGGEVK